MRRASARMPMAALALAAVLMPGPAPALATPPNGAAIAGISVTRVDTASFPRVAAFLNVTTDTGLPASGIVAADFRVLEDGAEVASGDIDVQGDTSQPIGMAFAIDIATTAEELAAVKSVVRAMINGFSARDQGAIISFGATPQIVQSVTNNPQALLAALDGLKAGGNFTAMNDGAQAAAREAAAFSAPAGRRVVALFTDSGDTSGVAVSAAVQAAQTAKAPVYAFGYGTRNKPDLADLGQKTGGAAYVSVAADGIAGNLQALNLALRQGYRLTFRSSVKADNGPHALVIAARSGNARGETSFVATPGKVAVTVLGLSEGRAVTTKVSLSAQATSPAPIASVEYLLDGVSIGRATAPPFIVDWDASRATPGTRKLTARVVDLAGNEGSAIISVLVPGPTGVSVSLSSDAPAGQPLRAGAELRATIALSAPVAIRRVETFVDSNKVSDVEGQAPAIVVVKTGDFAPGAHRVTVRVTDELGRVADAGAEFALAAPTTSPLNLAVVVGPLLSILATLAGLGLIGQIFASWRRGMARNFALDLANTGNAPARFGVRVFDSSESARVSILLNNQLLTPQDVGALQDGEETAAMALTRSAPTVRRATGPARAAGIAPGAAGAPDAAEAEDTGPKTKIEAPKLDASKAKELLEKKEKVVAAAGVGVAITNTVSDILLGMAAIMPEAIGRPMYSAGNSLRGATFVANRVDDAQQKVGRVAEQAGELKAKSDEAKKVAADAAKQAQELKGQAGAARQAAGDVAKQAAGPTLATAPRATTASVAEAAPAPVAAPRPARVPDFWALTPSISPGDAMTLTMRATPIHAGMQSPYTLRLESRPIELTAQGVLTNSDNITVMLGARSALQFWLPWILTALIVAAIIALALLLLSWAGLIRL